MCPNLGVERNLLPQCRITNRVVMYSVLYSMLVDDRCEEDVEEDLRDRYDVFRQVLHNYPTPLLLRSDENYEYAIYNALQHLFDGPGNAAVVHNDGDSSGSQSSLASTTSSELSAQCEFYDSALRARLGRLGGAGNDTPQPTDSKEDEQILDSGDEVN